MSSLACSGWTHLIFQLVHCLSRKLSSDSSMLYVFHSNSTTNVFCTLVAALGVVMSIWGFCRRRHKLNETLVCKHYNTLRWLFNNILRRRLKVKPYNKECFLSKGNQLIIDRARSWQSPTYLVCCGWLHDVPPMLFILPQLKWNSKPASG